MYIPKILIAYVHSVTGQAADFRATLAGRRPITSTTDGHRPFDCPTEVQC